MPRIRSLKPEVWMSPQVMNLSHSARLLFLGMITQADDEGRGTADPRRLKAAIFGGDDVDSSSVRRWIDECSSNGLATFYSSETHGELYELTGWASHQRIDRPKKSNYPTPSSSMGRRVVDDSSSIDRRGSDGSEGSLGSEGSECIRDRRSIDERSSNVPRGTIRAPIFDGWELWTELIGPIYPKQCSGADQVAASKGIERILGDRLASIDDLLTMTREFAAQKAAEGNTGTQFVMNAGKFFGPDGHWRGPFPLPAPKVSGARGSGHDWTPDADDQADIDRRKAATLAAKVG